MKYCFFVLIFVCFSLFASAQYSWLNDTIAIDEITITSSKLKKYQAGVKTEKIDSSLKEIVQDGNLETLLNRFSPIYIKSDAGGLSTIRFRGTSPNHTSINLGGLNLNSLTLGQSNMSTIPIYLFDEIELQHGSSSAVNGSGSIGGSIHLGLKNRWTKGIDYEGIISYGSFGRQFYGGKLFVGNGKFEAVSRFYYLYNKNNFPFLNSTVKDFETGVIGKRDKQQNASIKSMGFIQELNYKFSDKEYINSFLWLQNDWRQIQPNMQSNINSDLVAEEIKDENIRIWSQYENKKHKINYHIGLGFIRDFEVFNNIEDQEISTNRIIADIGIEQDLISNASYKIGLKYKYIVPEVYSYSTIDIEQHLDLYLSYSHIFFNKVKTSLNLRQMFVTNFKAPFTPALGIEYLLFKLPNSSIRLNGNIARSYRIPTLNDRFWGEQGNPKLKPEDGINTELGINYLYTGNKIKTEINVNAFYMRVNNWIEWRNFGVWQAQNVLEVISQGIEFQSKFEFNLNKTKIKTGINFTYNQVEAVKKTSETDQLFMQLYYVPKHIGNVWLTIIRKNIGFSSDGRYTGIRYYDNQGSFIDACFLTNATVFYNHKINNRTVKFSFMLNNIFAVEYQNQLNYAMPEINYKFGITIK